MKRRHTRRIGTIAILLGMLVFLVGAGACSNGSNEESETVDLLNDPEVGLAQLSGELNVVSELATDPKMGFDHLNEELHTIRKLATDPKVGFGHLNEEAHAVPFGAGEFVGNAGGRTSVGGDSGCRTSAAAGPGCGHHGGVRCVDYRLREPG